jgi:hypothetical protein
VSDPFEELLLTVQTEGIAARTHQRTAEFVRSFVNSEKSGPAQAGSGPKSTTNRWNNSPRYS